MTGELGTFCQIIDLLDKSYVDDCVSSLDTTKEVDQFRHHNTEFLREAEKCEDGGPVPTPEQRAEWCAESLRCKME